MSDTTNPVLPWVLFNLFIVAMLALDLLIFRRRAHVVSMREAVGWSIAWILLALLFNLYIYYARGWEDALSFATGYLIEKALSVDNLFIFLMIFRTFKTPEDALHTVLFWGVLGAILFRGLFIVAGISLVSHFHFAIYLFGLFLIMTGIKLLLRKEEEIDLKENPIIKLCHRFLPFTSDYAGTSFFIQREGRYYATPLFLTLVAIETIDVIFALDSIPAILAITFDPFLVYTSNIFAILGLRSLYLVLSEMLGLFHYLHYGLSLILVLIGLKMVLSDFIPIPTAYALATTLLILTTSVTASILFPPHRRQ